MTELVPFAYEGRQVRTVLVHGAPWWIAADVCAVLEIRNSRDALTGLDDDEKGVATTDTPGGDQRVSIINEPGLYSLILRSRKPEAKTFKRWITHEVIPSIRRTGRYEVAELSRLELIEIARTAELERLALEVKVAELEPALEAAEAVNTRNEPKVAYVETYVEPARDTTILRVLAKQLGVPEKALRDELLTRKVLYRRIIGTRWSNSRSRPVTEYQWLPRAGYESWFSLRDQPDAPRLHNGQLRTTLYVTPAGKAGIQNMLTAKPVGEFA